MTIREGAWLCEHCGATNRGRDVSCNGEHGQAGCGAARPSTVNFFLPENAGAVREAWLLRQARAGSAWCCDHCLGENHGDATSCRHCGQALDEGDTRRSTRKITGQAPRNAAEAAEFETAEFETAEFEAAKVDAVTTRAVAAAPQPTNTRTKSRPASANPRQSSRITFGSITLGSTAAAFIILVGAALVASLLWALLSTQPVPGSIQSMTWARTISVETQKDVEREGWDAPAGAVILSSETRQRGTETIVTGYTSGKPAGGVCGSRDLGNGFFQDTPCPAEAPQPITKQIPVEDVWLRWRQKMWVESREVDAAGDNTVPPAWPEIHIAIDEREGARNASYTVTITLPSTVAAQNDAQNVAQKQKQVALPVEESLWHTLKPGDPVIAHRNRFGGINKIERAP